MDSTQIYYIHYGAKSFNPEMNFPIKNQSFPWVKPKGGLWASRINADFGWKDWCKVEEFRDCEIDNSFVFELSKTSNVKRISTTQQLHQLPNLNIDQSYNGIDSYYIDFEKCLETGIDAIELCYYGDEYKSIRHGNLHFALYGWDCDSIVILNPNIVSVINKEDKNELYEAFCGRSGN